MEQAIAIQGFSIIDQLLSYGPVGILIILFIVDRMGWLNIHRSNTKNSIIEIEKKICNINGLVSDLHDWHNVVDDNGVKKWYTSRSLENTIKKVGDVLDEQVKLTRELVYEMKQNNREINDLREKINV